MAHSTRNNSKKSGKHVTRNQQRKLDYARLAALAAKKGGGDIINSASKGRALKKTNHKKGFAQTASQKRHEEAIYRNDGWSSLTPLEQIADLDKRLGPGVGAVKQRVKILKRILAPYYTTLTPKGDVKGVMIISDQDKIIRKAKQARKESRDQRAINQNG